MKPTPPCFTQSQLESVAQILADTSSGLTGSEIARLLQRAKIEDIDPSNTKWKRLANALGVRQNKDRSGDRTLAFIAKAMDPVRYQGDPSTFHARLTDLNVVLAFYGLQLGEDGKYSRIAPATTLTEAEHRADTLRAALRQRDVHPDVLRYCRAELLQHDCFHAVLEATKSVAEKIRTRSGLSSDGATLVDEALGGDAPTLRINALATPTHWSEQRGFVNLAKGLFGTFRNPTAHAPRIDWPLSEEDALDLFCLASYIHRRIDAATAVPFGVASA